MLSELVIPLKVSLMASVIGYVYIHYLTEPGMFLGWWKKWLAEKLIEGQEVEWKAMLFKVVAECEQCFTGQLAMWSFLFYCQGYSLWLHIFTISLSILFVSLLAKLR